MADEGLVRRGRTGEGRASKDAEGARGMGRANEALPWIRDGARVARVRSDLRGALAENGAEMLGADARGCVIESARAPNDDTGERASERTRVRQGAYAEPDRGETRAAG